MRKRPKSEKKQQKSVFFQSLEISSTFSEFFGFISLILCNPKGKPTKQAINQ